jgi:hypothetical protein
LAKETIAIIGREDLEWRLIGKTAIKITNHRSRYKTLLPPKLLGISLEQDVWFTPGSDSEHSIIPPKPNYTDSILC